jgi:hypothetical protein
VSDAHEHLAAHLHEKKRDWPDAQRIERALPPGCIITLDAVEAPTLRALLLLRAEEYLRERDVLNRAHGALLATLAGRLLILSSRARLAGVETLLWIGPTEYFHALAAVAPLPHIAARMRASCAMLMERVA